MTILYCPLRQCKHNDAFTFEDEGICAKEELELGQGDYRGIFSYCQDFEPGPPFINRKEDK